MDVRLGMAAWGYDHLVGALYPPGTPARQRLRRYAQVYPFVEVDSLRYAWPDDARLSEWKEQVPPDFLFVPKMHGSLTHAHKPSLGDAADWWAALSRLRDQIPCVLVQFPATFQNSPANLARVLDLMAPVTVACVVEMRHPSWKAAWPDLLAAKAVPCWPLLDGVAMPEHAGPEVGYVRIIGDRAIPKQEMGVLRRDRMDDLEALGRRVRSQPWRTCFVVVTNFFEGSAPLSIERLAAAWSLEVPDRSAAGRTDGQASLF